MSKQPDGVFVVIRNDNNEILFGFQRERQIWSLPGGGLETNEGLYAGAVREVWEETGLSVQIVRWLGLLTLQRTPTCLPETIYLFEAEVVGGQLQPDGDEIEACRYFSLAELEIVGTGPSRFGFNQYALAYLGFYYDYLSVILVETNLSPSLVEWIKAVKSAKSINELIVVQKRSARFYSALIRLKGSPQLVAGSLSA